MQATRALKFISMSCIRLVINYRWRLYWSKCRQNWSPWRSVRSIIRHIAPMNRIVWRSAAFTCAFGDDFEELLGLDRIPACGIAPAYATAEELVADLDIIHQSLCKPMAGRYTSWLFASLLCRAACGFRFLALAPIDLRQKFRCTRTLSQSCYAANPEVDYLSRNEDQRIEILIGEISSARPLASPYLDFTGRGRNRIGAIYRAVLAAQRWPVKARYRIASSPKPMVFQICWNYLVPERSRACCPAEDALASISFLEI